MGPRSRLSIQFLACPRNSMLRGRATHPQESDMSAGEKFQADLQQTKADFSKLKSEIERGAAKVKAELETQVDTERGKDKEAYRAMIDDPFLDGDEA
jgi:hypothetical protein